MSDVRGHLDDTKLEGHLVNLAVMFAKKVERTDWADRVASRA